MHVKLVHITPAIAADLLGGNLHNRTLRQRAVATLAQDIIDGRWSSNGETIKITEDGLLIDGQHRLAAVIAADRGVDMLVVQGVAPEAQETIDTGRARTFGDVLTLRGMTDGRNVASATRLVWEYVSNGNVLAPHGGAIDKAPTHGELSALLDENPDIVDAMRYGVRVALRVPVITRGQAALVVWLTRRLDVADSEYFFEALIGGANLDKGDPILVLSKTFENWSQRPHSHPDRVVIVGSTIKAWNAFRAGDRVKLIAYRPGGSRPERFPEPK